MTKELPFNIFSIKDIDEWRRDFFFPISLKTCERVEKKICSTLIKEYDRVKKEYHPHFRIASKSLVLECYDLIIKFIIANRMKNYQDVKFYLSNHRLTKDVVLPERNITFDIYKGIENIELPNIDLHYNDPHFINLSPIQKTGQFVKTIFERLNKRKINKYVIIPSGSTIEYLENVIKEDFIIIRPFVVFRRSLNKRKYKSNQYFYEIAKRISADINCVLNKEEQVELPPKIKEKLELSIANLFNRIEYELNLVEKYYDKNIKSPIQLYTGTGKHFTRIFSEVVRKKGGEVIAFPHEGGLSGLDLPVLSFTEFSTCDKFVCFDKLDSLDYQKYPKINRIYFPVIKELGESVLNINKEKHLKSKIISLSNINNVMYVFYGQHIDNYASGTRNDLVGFDLQLKIIDYFLKFNKKIIFKNRPKTQSQSNSFNHFGYYKDKVEYSSEPFDKVLKDADLFIIEGVGTKSLHEAMTLTDTPIILFKASFPKCTEEYETEMKKRCFVIDLYEDSENRLCFDEEKLESIIKE